MSHESDLDFIHEQKSMYYQPDVIVSTFVARNDWSILYRS